MASNHRAKLKAAWVAGTLTAWALALPWSCGCAASESHVVLNEPDITERVMLDAFPCEGLESTPEEERAARATKLHLSIDADHVRFARQEHARDHRIFAALGDACTGATDRAVCLARVAELEEAGRSKAQVYAITTARDDVEIHEGPDVLALLGAIDNADKAWLALMVGTNTPPYVCGHAEWHGVRAVTTGFQTSRVWTRETCPPAERVQTIVHVDHAGSLTRLHEHVVDRQPECVVNERLIKGDGPR